MKKRILSLLMAFVMAVGLLPASALAADSMTVYVTISDKGVLAADKNGEPMGYREITVTDQDADGKLTIYDAYTAAHKQYCDSEFLVNGSGMVGQLWGDHSGNFLTFVNNAGISGASLQEQVIGDGDHLVGAILSDTSYWSDYISFFDSLTKTVSVGEEVTLTLKGRAGMSWTGEDGPDAALSGLSVGTWNNGGFSAIDGKTTDENGQVTLSFDAEGTYYVTASGRVNGFAPIIAPVCVVTVSEEKSDAECVAADKDALEITYVNGQNITLPDTGASGKTVITWASDKTDVISDKGIVNLPAQDTEVTLTATITCNQVSGSKVFTVHVLGCLNAVKAALNSDTLKPEEFTGKTEWGYEHDSVAKDKNILTLAQEKAKQVDTVVEVTLDDEFVEGDVIGEDGTITYPAAETTVEVPFVLSANGETVKHSVTVQIPKHAKTKAEAIEALKQTITWDAIKNKNSAQDTVKTELKLLRGKSTGLQITWSVTPSDTGALVIGEASSSSWANTVTQPQYGKENAELTLTATLGYADNATMIDAGPMPESDNTVEFQITVPALNEEEYNALMAEMDAALNDAASKITVAMGTSAGSSAATLTSVTDDLYLDNLLKTTNGYKTVWISTNTAISAPVNGTGVAKVTIPREGEAVTGQLQVKLTKFGYEKTKSFDVTVPVWSDEIMAAKQADVRKVAEALDFNDIKGGNTSDTEVTKKLSLPINAELSGTAVNFRTYNSGKALYKITWQSSHPAIVAANGAVTRPAESTLVTLTATVERKTPVEGISAETKTITINVPKLHTPNTAESLEELLDGIAAQTANTTNWESFLAMAAYEGARPSGSKLTEAAKQNMINTSVAKVSAASPKESDWTKAILDMQGMGVDPRQLYPVNSNTPVDAVAGLNGMAHSTGVWTAAYTLLSWQQGDYSVGTQEADLVTALLATQLENGGWTSWETAEADATGLVIQALAAYYDSNAAVKTALDKAVSYLSGVQLDNGGFGGQWGENANNVACVISGLCAMGIDPDTDSRFIKNGYSALDALLTYAVDDNTGFSLTAGDGTVNAYSTQQGFPALIAAYQVIKNNTAYNVYDFSGNTLVPGRATGTGSVVTPSDPSGGDITVTLTIKSDTGYWLRSKGVTLPGTDATVYHALVQGLEGSGITQVGAETGYVKSMTKGGTTLEEFGSGKNAGWMYKLNGEVPEVGLTDCEIENGDEIVWFYTEDWASVPGAGGLGSVDQEEIEEPTAFPFTDVSEGDYYYDAVRWAVEKGITLGTSDTTFHPEAGCTRGQMVTFLWRAAGEPAAKASACPFTDVDKDAYYYEALLWAVENGITTGTSDTKFSPNADCTRGQMAVFLYRSAKTPAVSGSHTFDDVKSDAYYNDAVTWAAAEGITTGTSETTFHPNGDCTRGQMVTFLMRWLAETP